MFEKHQPIDIRSPIAAHPDEVAGCKDPRSRLRSRPLRCSTGSGAWVTHRRTKEIDGDRNNDEDRQNKDKKISPAFSSCRKVSTRASAEKIQNNENHKGNDHRRLRDRPEEQFGEAIGPRGTARSWAHFP